MVPCTTGPGPTVSPVEEPALYLLLKHLHVSCVVLSGLGFVLRGYWKFRRPEALARPWVRWA
ncbi:MAG: SirB2 family protein, partial [Azovibrio sp.]|nr:SirB2 family protein [Azovibrio sp.]